MFEKKAYTTMEFKNVDGFYAFNKKIENVSQMQFSERAFLNELVLQFQPQKALEIGIAEGASSAIMLNSLSDNSVLYSIDYFENYYLDASKKSGWKCMELFPESHARWHLYTGGMSAKFMDLIGDGIDFCLLDGAHVNPGELLDFLMVYPYLTKDALVVIHDISLYSAFFNTGIAELQKIYRNVTTCRLLFSLLRGEKILPAQTEHKYYENIGAVILNDDIEDCIVDIFYALTLPWDVSFNSYGLLDADICFLSDFFEKHYGVRYAKIFHSALLSNKEMIDFELNSKCKVEKS